MHDISDLEYHKLNQILEAFSHNAVLNGFNDDYIYIYSDGDMYKLDRNKVSPDMSAESAAKCIKLFE